MKNINRKNNTQKPEIPGKVKKGFRFYAAAVLSLALVMGMSVTAFAAGDPITVVNNLSDFIFGLIRAVGLILSVGVLCRSVSASRATIRASVPTAS